MCSIKHHHHLAIATEEKERWVCGLEFVFRNLLSYLRPLGCLPGEFGSGRELTLRQLFLALPSNGSPHEPPLQETPIPPSYAGHSEREALGKTCVPAYDVCLLYLRAEASRRWG